MNYFELINKCLVELNYKKCRSFIELTKNDHDKIKNILNLINAEVCGFDNWSFLLRKVEVSLPKNTGEILNIIPGRLHSLFVDGLKYTYCADFERFLQNKELSQTFSAFNNKLLLPIFTEDKTIEIIYYTNKFAQNEAGEDISLMEEETDVSIVPMPYLEPILVYGTCMRLKGNPQYTKFNYWFGMYKDALATMRSKIGTDAHATPEIKMERR